MRGQLSGMFIAVLFLVMATSTATNESFAQQETKPSTHTGAAGRTDAVSAMDDEWHIGPPVSLGGGNARHYWSTWT